jgi:TPR repeat protein
MARCYHFGKGGFDQSNEQAIYWYQKYLEIENDDEEVLSVLARLRDL